MKIHQVLFLIATVILFEGDAAKKKTVPECTLYTAINKRAEFQCGSNKDPHFHKYPSNDHVGSFKIGYSEYKIPIQEKNKRDVCCRVFCDLMDRKRGGNGKASFGDIGDAECLMCMEELAKHEHCKGHWDMAKCKCPK